MKPTLWIIDGNNLIHRDPQLNAIRIHGGLESAMKVLQSELWQLQKKLGRGHSVALVFDGVVAFGTRSEGGRGLRVLRPNRNQDADYVILEEVSRFEGIMDLYVVSSDAHDIGRNLRGRDVTWYTVSEFLPTLRPTRRRVSGKTTVEEEEDSDKPDKISPEEAAHWYRLFGEEDPGDE